MLGNLFKNPKAALAYVGITVVGVVLFVGTEDDPGSLSQTVDSMGGGKSASDVAAERKFGDPPAGETGETKRPKPKKNVVYTFASDEELVDEASGFDPTPTQDFSGFDPTPAEERPFLSEQDNVKPEDVSGGWGAETEAEQEKE